MDNDQTRQHLASQAVDLALETLVGRLERVKAGKAELTPSGRRLEEPSLNPIARRSELW